MSLKLGRLAPHDPATHPRLRLRDFLAVGAYPAAPATVDYISEVAAWPMYLNDQLGDCTIAAAGHMVEAWTRFGSGTAVEVTNEQILTAYEAVSGYKPGQPDTDQGAVMQDVLDYWRTTGIGGHKILAFAEVDVKSAAELKAAMALFGHVYLGINFPDSAMDQFDAHQPWDVVEDTTIEGGHAIDWGYAADGENHRIITWGAVQQMTPAFFAKYVEEAWVVVSAEWLSAAGKSPEGLDTAALGAAFAEMTGEANPFPAGPPQPDPEPAPVVDQADHDLVAALTGWLSTRHTGSNATAAKAVRAWMTAKGLDPVAEVSSGLHMPDVIQVHHRSVTGKFELTIDGETFPYAVALEPVEAAADGHGGFPKLRVTLLTTRLEYVADVRGADLILA